MTNSYIGKFNPKKPVRVYGAGISGLITAYYAKESGYKVELHEKKPTPGGLIQLEKTDYGFIDSAAHTILINSEIEDLLNKIELEPEYFPEKTKRFLVKKYQDFEAYPVSLKQFPSIIKNGFKKIPDSALHKDASVADFFTPWIGTELTEQVVSTALSGIYANGAQTLHFSSIFPEAKAGQRYISWAKDAIKKMTGKRLKSASFSKGMAELPYKLAEKLEDNIFYESQPEIDDQYNNIICTNAHDAAELLPRARTLLNDIPYQGVYKTTVFLEQAIEQLDGAFGALLSEESDFHSMGIINTSHLFPHRTQDGLYQYSFVHKSTQDYIDDLTLLGLKKPVFEKQVFWEKGIPIYSALRANTIELLRKRDLGSCILFGNYTGEISLRKIMNSAQSFF